MAEARPSVFALFSGLKHYTKPKPKVEVPRPDNLVFVLQYKVMPTNASLPPCNASAVFCDVFD